MKKLFLALALMAITLVQTSSAFAGPAAAYVGWYRIIGTALNDQPVRNEYLLIDNDTLGNIWAKYADGPLPANLEQYRNEPTVLCGFTNRETVFLSFEKNVLVGDGFMRVAGNGDNLFEIALRSDGQYNVGVRENGVITRYLMDAPVANPTNTNLIPMKLAM